MTILQLSEEDYYTKLGEANNPPDPSVQTAAFDDEYYSLYERVKVVMSGYGENDPYGQGDYYLEPHIAQSRGLGLSISNAGIVTSELLQALQGIVSQHAPLWEIYLGSSEYDFGIFIGSESIWLHRNSSDLLPQLTKLIAKIG